VLEEIVRNKKEKGYRKRELTGMYCGDSRGQI